MSIQEVWPSGEMALLTQNEADSISLSSKGKLYDLYRNCSLAVLNSGNLTDNSKELLENYENFEINVLRNERGLKIELINPPESSVVDGRIIKTLRNHLYSVLRDLVQIKIYKETYEKNVRPSFNTEGEFITNSIFMLLRNAQVMQPGTKPNLAVCWGGHSISRLEYDYAYDVGIELGLRKIDICTGCGPGIMEAPMKGSMVGHSQQCACHQCRLVGLTEPSIIAAEPPNAMVSDLVILPDIEKRLEAFVRLGHVLIVFPGGPGTAEELLYILSIKLMEENRRTVMPLILTGNEESRPYFEALENFLVKDARTNTSRICQKGTADAKLAKLHYDLVDTTFFADIASAIPVATSQLKIKLDTGRHHQIRVQLSGMGCPIIGDTKYNPDSPKLTARRTPLCLCAYQLEFRHPVTKKAMTFSLDHYV